jgi:hypothetical protein
MNLHDMFGRLWEDYTAQNPSVQKIHKLFTSAGEEVMNDHIAFRTFEDQRVGIDVLAKPFLKIGYVEKGEYHFEEKKLFAKHFEHPGEPNAPRVFISELMTNHFSQFLQDTVNEWISGIPFELFQSEDLLFSGSAWMTPSYEVYNQLREESEYAGWLYVHGFRANHFTVSINSLKKFDTIEKVNRFIKDNGFQMNASGGEVKGTPDELLQQSSTMSEKILVRFTEGVFEIPGCYYEFAIRYPDTSGTLYSGFIAKSADKIFESTDLKNE